MNTVLKWRRMESICDRVGAIRLDGESKLLCLARNEGVVYGKY